MACCQIKTSVETFIGCKPTVTVISFLASCDNLQGLMYNRIHVLKI